MNIPHNPITKEKLKAALDEVRSLDYENFHPRWKRAYWDYEHSLRVLIAFKECDDAGCGEAS